jgi:hypothetical protein
LPKLSLSVKVSGSSKKRKEAETTRQQALFNADSEQLPDDDEVNDEPTDPTVVTAAVTPTQVTLGTAEVCRPKKRIRTEARDHSQEIEVMQYLKDKSEVRITIQIQINIILHNLFIFQIIFNFDFVYSIP